MREDSIVGWKGAGFEVLFLDFVHLMHQRIRSTGWPADWIGHGWRLSLFLSGVVLASSS